MSDFEMLCDELHLSEQLNNAEQLTQLKTRCHDEISRDIVFSGSAHEQYTQYLTLAKNYLDDFLPHVPKDITEKVSEFEDMNALQFAADNGYEYFLAKLPKTLPVDSFDLKDEYGMEALHFAALKGHVHTVKTLLKKGANPCVLNDEQQMPAYSALLVSMLDHNNKTLLANKEKIFRLLVENSLPSLLHQDDSGDTLFHMLAMSKFSDLLKDMLDINPSGATIANNQTHFPIHSANLNNKKDNADLLFNCLPEVATQVDSNQRIPLHYAAIYGSYDMVDLCIRYTMDINARDSMLKTPLILAAENNNQDADYLLIHHKDIDKSLPDINNQTYENHKKKQTYDIR